jgi:IS30 family transposase
MIYTHVNRDERYQIAILEKAHLNQSEIVKMMARDKSSISRELRRNRVLLGYRFK